METPKKQNAQNTSNMLKRALNDKAYLKALDRMIQIQKNALKNGLYLIDDERFI